MQTRTRPDGIKLWKEAYKISLKTVIQFKKRLRQLQTWDNCNHHEDERLKKITALEQLITEAS